MKLYLAVAVLLLAFVAYSDAQNMEEFGQQLSESFQAAAEKAKVHFQNIQNSDIPVKVKNFFQEYFDKIRDAVQQK